MDGPDSWSEPPGDRSGTPVRVEVSPSSPLMELGAETTASRLPCEASVRSP